jgi:hypothetical protein
MAGSNKWFKVLKHHKMYQILFKPCAVYPKADSLAPTSLETSVITPSLLVGQGESPVPQVSEAPPPDRSEACSKLAPGSEPWSYEAP